MIRALRTFLLPTLSVTVMTALGCGGAQVAAPEPVAPAAAFVDADREAIVGLLEAQRQAWNRSDLDSFMIGYLESEELVFTSGGNIRRGWQTTLDNYRKNYGSRPEGMGTLEFDVLELRPLGADGAVMLGRFRLVDTPSPSSGVFTLVFERTAAGWKIVHDHTSGDPPDETPPAPGDAPAAPASGE